LLYKWNLLIETKDKIIDYFDVGVKNKVRSERGFQEKRIRRGDVI
jgi:hypothetical protein